MTFARAGTSGRVTDHLDSDRTVDDPTDADRYVDVRHYPGQVHRIDVDAVNENHELRTVPAGRVHEVAVWSDGDRERVLGPYEGCRRACEVAVDLAEQERLPLRDVVPRLVPDDDTREQRRREGRWPPHRDEAREFRAELPDDLQISPDDHDISVRISIDPDPNPPSGDDVPLDGYADTYDVLLTHNTSPYEVIEQIEERVESRRDAIDTAVDTAREREWAVYTRMASPSTGS
ncbi:hypothetical protein [Halomarina litorea]|uniref:hypothetical protein n=1 Tax=Halomarina litorea TaxID=2961595 RepID=UPI0020C230A1|nr:hypothetical protein [Halomarina sp. BCD28]